MNNKLSHNPSMSPSSPASFDANNICGSKTAAGCLAGILRRILCSRSLPTHPSDHITDHATSVSCPMLRELESKEKFVEGKVTPIPSVVARLMGLETMPTVVVSSTTPNSIGRSRSMNSMDYFKQSSDDRSMQGGHRRVKSTLSFREMPAFVELENEEFVVLSFENESEKKDKRFTGRKCETGNGELKQSKGEKCKNNDGKAKVTEQKNKGDQRNGSQKKLREQCALGSVSDDTGAKFRKKKKVKSVEHECCSSEESSPVSVLDFHQFVLDRGFPPSELDSESLGLTSRRKLSPEPENNECQSRRPNDNISNIPDDRKTKKPEGRCLGWRKRDCNNQNYMDICEQICKMAEADIVEESHWMHRRNTLKREDLENICADFELQILDQSLDEVVHQLTELPLKI